MKPRGLWCDVAALERRDMTVCIAAICKDGDNDKIVLCSDTKKSSALGSAETGKKDLPIAHRWRLLTAGNEPEIIALHRLYKQRFDDINNLTAEKLDDSIGLPLRQRKKDLSDEYIFSRYNMSYADFIAVGKDKFPDDEFRNAVRNVAALNLRASLIVAGFVDQSPEVYYTDMHGIGRATNDFAVIGEGEYIAQSVLLRREQNSDFSLHETLYNVYEAKRYSESIGSVGKYTTLAILSSGAKRELTSLGVDKQLKKCYEQYGPKPLPDDFTLNGPIFYSEEKAKKSA
jgi:20S proteasome alpha/beta subunit